MSQKSIEAVHEFYHDNHQNGKYNVRYNSQNLGKINVSFHCQANKWTIVLSNISIDIDETQFDTNGDITYNKSCNTLVIKQYNTLVKIF